MSTRLLKTMAHRRSGDIKSMLEERGRELEHEVRGKIRHARHRSDEEREVLDEGEACEVDVQSGLEFALLQIKADTLSAIDEAVRRLGDGTYGNCFECGERIHEARLQALPFAVRCKACEDVREMTAQRGTVPVSRDGSFTIEESGL